MPKTFLACKICGASRIPSHPLCPAHWAEAQRDYRKLQKTKYQRESYRMGIETARKTIIEEFRRLGPKGMNGTTAAYIVRDLQI